MGDIIPTYHVKYFWGDTHKANAELENFLNDNPQIEIIKVDFQETFREKSFQTKTGIYLLYKG
jgi:hypothetical protein